MQTEQLLCWSGMTDTEHTTSGLNEEGRSTKMFPLRSRPNLCLLFEVNV